MSAGWSSPRASAGPSALVCGPRGEEELARAIELIRRYARGVAPGATVRWREQDRDRTCALGAPASDAAESTPALPAAL